MEAFIWAHSNHLAQRREITVVGKAETNTGLYVMTRSHPRGPALALGLDVGRPGKGSPDTG